MDNNVIIISHWEVFDYVDNDGVNQIREWSEGLEKRDLAKFNAKLDMLQKAGGSLPPKLLSHTGVPHIFKIRINGEVALRPFVCRGPINPESEFTILVGAHEKDRKLIPSDAKRIAQERRNEIIKNDARRRKHEHVSSQPKKGL